MKKLKRINAILLALVMVLGIGVNVSADSNTALIDPNKKGSITIHKFDDNGESTEDNESVFNKPGDGTLITDTTDLGNPLGGITFKITLIPDATSNMTVVQAKGAVDAMTAAMTKEELAEYQKTGMTSNGGVYTFADIKQGIYLVEEVENTMTTGVSPFLVSIPMVDPTDHSSWMYDIHVYPKNTMADGTIDKKVLDENGDKQLSVNKSIGEEVKWVIGMTFPGSIANIDAADSSKGYFYITDSLDSRLNFKSVKVEVVSFDGTSSNELIAGTDYILTAPAVGAAGTNDQDIKIDFKTAAGLQKLINTPVDSKIEITVTTVVNETAVTSLATAIMNSAELYFNNEDGDPTDPEDPVTPPIEETPEVDLVGIAIKKVDEKGELLDGATFTIYKTMTDAGEGKAILQLGADWTETSGESLAIVDSSPVEYVKGYLYFSGENMDKLELPSAPKTKYYIVETKVPNGYDLLNTIHELECGTTTTITNIKSPGFTLPITGGSGTLLFTIIGIALIGGAVTLLVVLKKRKRVASN